MNPHDAELPSVARALERHVRAWYRGNGSHPTTPADEASILVYSVNAQSRLETLFGRTYADILQTPPKRILDTGCGYGSFAVLLAAALPETEVLATDISDRFYPVGQAAALDLGLANIRFESRDLRTLNLAPDYDLVVSCNMLNFMPTKNDLTAALNSLLDATRPGGLVFVHTPHFWSIREPFTGVPFLQFLPRTLQSAVARALRKRSTLDDNRHPSLSEIRRVVSARGGRIEGLRHPSAVVRLLRSHITFWIAL